MKRVFLAVFVTLAIVFTVWYGYTPVVLEVKTPPKKAAPLDPLESTLHYDLFF